MKQTKKELVIGVDIGGTHIRIGTVETAGSRVLGLSKSKTAELTLDKLCASLEGTVSQNAGKIGGIGVVVPGCCSADLRRSISTDGIVPFLDGCDLADIIEKRVGIPTRIDNDVRAHTIGELRKFYALADAVFVGRTLVDLGHRQHGSDMIEPAALAKAVVVGPFTANFAEAMNCFRRAEAMMVVQNARELEATIATLLSDSAAASRLGLRAREVVKNRQGATQRHARIILDTLKTVLTMKPA